MDSPNLFSEKAAQKSPDSRQEKYDKGQKGQPVTNSERYAENSASDQSATHERPAEPRAILSCAVLVG